MTSLPKSFVGPRLVASLLGAVAFGVALTWSVFAYGARHWEEIYAPVRTGDAPSGAVAEYVNLLWVRAGAVVLPIVVLAVVVLAIFVALRVRLAVGAAFVVLPIMVCGSVAHLGLGGDDRWLVSARGWTGFAGIAGPILVIVAGIGGILVLLLPSTIAVVGGTAA
jgi:hypothetical protein